MVTPGGVLPGGVVRGAAADASCDGAPASEVARLISATRVDNSWRQASNVAIQPIQVCPDVRVWMTSQLTGSGLGPVLRDAVVSDDLISTSLSRSSYAADRVFAVKKSGAQLTVYVY